MIFYYIPPDIIKNFIKSITSISHPAGESLFNDDYFLQNYILFMHIPLLQINEFIDPLQNSEVFNLSKNRVKWILNIWFEKYKDKLEYRTGYPIVIKNVPFQLNTDKCQSPLLTALSYNNIQLSKLFIKLGSNVNAIDIFGLDTAHYAVINSLDVLKLLILYGINNTNKYSTSILMVAAYHGQKKIVKYLLQLDSPYSNVNYISNAGYSALIFASMQGHTKIIKLLLAHGADTSTYKYSASNQSLKYGHYITSVHILMHNLLKNKTYDNTTVQLIPNGY